MKIAKQILTCLFFIFFIACGTPEKPKIDKKTPDEMIKVEFDWVKCEECFVEIQKPRDWHFHKSVIPNGFEYYITPYHFEDLGFFKRGLSLVVISNLKKSMGLRPSQQAELFIINAKKINPQLNVKRSDMQELQGSSFLIRDPAETPESLISSIFLIANDNTDTFYTFVFQFEKRDWQAMQPISSQMLKNLKVSKEY